MSASENTGEDEHSSEEQSPRKGLRKWFKSSEKPKLKLVRTLSVQSADPSLLRLRVPYEPLSLTMKKSVLAQWPSLALFAAEEGAYARNFLICGMNALRAEVLDMLSMVYAMNEHKKVLTHAAVERFFAWVPIFEVYVERYFYVEEDVILKNIEEHVGRVHGHMRTGNRMQLRGRLQKAIRDMSNTKQVFVRSLPAGEKLHKLFTIAELVAELTVLYTTRFIVTLTPLVEQGLLKAEVNLLRARLIKYVMSHVGANDLLVLYTRWMHPRELQRWKARALMPAEFTYRSYSKWEKNVMYGHFIIPAKFTDVLVEETTDDIDQAEQWRQDLRRAQSARAKLEAGDYDYEEEYDEEEEDCEQGEGRCPLQSGVKSRRLNEVEDYNGVEKDPEESEGSAFA